MCITQFLKTLDICSIARLADGTLQSVPTEVTAEKDHLTARIPREQIPEGTQTLDFLPAFFTGQEGEDGYMVFPGNMLCRFAGHENTKKQACSPVMPLFGAKTERFCFAGIVTGDRADSIVMADIENGAYRTYPRFLLEGDGAPEDPAVEYHFLTGEEADYSGMARIYRKKRLAEGLIPLRERVKNRPALAYAAEAPYIRIRMGWKPVPSPVPEQTSETEPPMFTACDCGQVEKLLDAMHSAGIDKAELCLVGWNVRGHDGRWPQALPVEEGIGGESALRALIAKAQSMGYQITCHTNNSDAYRIADCFDEGFLRKNKDGSIQKGGTWSGGNMYNTCPAATWEISRNMLDRVEALGFRGLHYIDVVSVVPPKKCADPEHPLTRAEDAAWYNRLFRYASDKFGGIASEGGFDHMSDVLDYGLYIHFGGNRTNPLCDEDIPLWQMVYHGSILHNPSTNTVNYTLKDTDALLEEVEFGGRPSFYYYSRFVTESAQRKNWMGTADMRCGTPEELAESVDALRRSYAEYQTRRALQYCFMEKHEKLAEGVYRVTYSDGTVILVNRGDAPYEAEKLAGKSYRIDKR